MGKRRPVPNAFDVTRRPTGAWRRLYSFFSMSPMVFSTASFAWPAATISSEDLPSSM